VVKKAKGVWVEDVDGNRFLDFNSGIAVCNTGHCHPRVVEAIHRQAEQLIHMSGSDFYYEAQSNLAAKLAEITPGPKEKKVFFGNSGAEAIEAALKLARFHTRRPFILAFLGAFHGRTMGALSLTASKAIFEKGFSPLVPGVTHVPYPYCYRCPYHHHQYPGCSVACVEWIREDLFKRSIPPEEVAAIFVEPIQGEGGYVVPPPEFHKKLYDLAKEFGILFVADEVQSGKDVIHEDAIKVAGATKAPDYCFRIGGVRKFFLETKKPSIDIREQVNPAYQLKRYAWSAKLPLSILTDFEEMAIYDCRLRIGGQ
jgi:4-aminobutyrate aminotransferase